MQGNTNKRKKPALSSYNSSDFSRSVRPLWQVFLLRALGYVLGYGVILFLALFMMAKSGWSAYVDGLKPFILVLPVIFFAVYRPTFFPPMMVLALGLVMDLFIGVPFGLSPLVALIIYFILSRLLTQLLDFPPVFLVGLAVVPITAAEMLRWLGVSLLSAEVQPLLPAFFAAAWSCAIYFCLALVFHAVLRLISAR